MPGDNAVYPTEEREYVDAVLGPGGEIQSPCGVIVRRREGGMAYLESAVYYDGLGREIQRKREHEEGWLTTDSYYDEAGRLYRLSVPYFTTEREYTPGDANQPFTETEFDILGREIRMINSEGTSSRTYYGKKGEGLC